MPKEVGFDDMVDVRISRSPASAMDGCMHACMNSWVASQLEVRRLGKSAFLQGRVSTSKL